MKRIEAVGIGKAYRTYRHKWGRAAEWLGAPPQHALHWVLRDVNMELHAGECVGIIGLNGAGKSTLLKIVSGVTKPTTGTVQRWGTLATLLELGMGFHPDFSGRHNVYMAGQLRGLSADEVSRRMREIESFAEIGDYIDAPVRTYSSGMQVRLAFSVATAVRPDILIVDEALAVGDIQFQQKCYERIRSFRNQGTTLLFVSHSMPAVLHLCNRALLLRQGRVEIDGSPKDVTDLYQADVLLLLDKRPEQIRVATKGKASTTQAATGSLATASVELLSARILDSGGRETNVVEADARIRVEFVYAINRSLDDPHVGFKVRNQFGVVLFETNSYCMRKPIGACPRGARLVARFDFRALIAPGDYTITAGFANRGFGAGSFEEALDYRHEVAAFSVARMSSSIHWMGLINLEPDLGVETHRDVA